MAAIKKKKTFETYTKIVTDNKMLLDLKYLYNCGKKYLKEIIGL